MLLVRDRRLFPASALVLRIRKKRGKFRVAMFNRIGKNVWDIYHVRFHKSHKCIHGLNLDVNRPGDYQMFEICINEKMNVEPLPKA